MSPRNPAVNEHLREHSARAILAAAQAEFGAHGVGGARVARIARRAGVSTGLVYNYFPSREALLEAVLAAYLERGVDLLLRAGRGDAVDARDALARYLDDVLDEVRENPDGFRFYLGVLLHP